MKQVTVFSSQTLVNRKLRETQRLPQSNTPLNQLQYMAILIKQILQQSYNLRVAYKTSFLKGKIKFSITYTFGTDFGG